MLRYFVQIPGSNHKSRWILGDLEILPLARYVFSYARRYSVQIPEPNHKPLLLQDRSADRSGRSWDRASCTMRALLRCQEHYELIPSYAGTPYMSTERGRQREGGQWVVDSKSKSAGECSNNNRAVLVESRIISFLVTTIRNSLFVLRCVFSSRYVQFIHAVAAVDIDNSLKESSPTDVVVCHLL